MNRSQILAICLLVLSSAAFAHDPPPLPQVVPPRLPPPPSRFVPSPPLPARTAPITIDELKQMGLSPTVYRDLAAQINNGLQPSALAVGDEAVLAISPARSRRFTATTLTTPSNYAFLNNDTNEDTESSVISVPLATTGVNTPFVAWMQYESDPSQGFHVNVSHWSSTPGTWIPAPEVLSNRSRVGDPMLAAHPYVAGFNPQTVYCVATSYNMNPGNATVTGDSAITVWQNSGYGWSSQDVDFRPFNTFWFLNKPSIFVSINPATHGAVYVAYRENGFSGNSSAAPSIIVAMKNEFTEGQFQRRSRVPVPTTGNGSQSVNDAIQSNSSSTRGPAVSVKSSAFGF